jgi:hypothetical protein
LLNIGVKSIITIPADKKKDIDWDEVVKKEARGINDADFGEVQLIWEIQSLLRKVLL